MQTKSNHGKVSIDRLPCKFCNIYTYDGILASDCSLLCWTYFPMQKVAKMRVSMSSVVVSPVIWPR
jgi:hypothetical protein